MRNGCKLISAHVIERFFDAHTFDGGENSGENMSDKDKTMSAQFQSLTVDSM